MPTIFTKEIICPRCFSDFPGGRIHFRCMKVDCPGRGPDSIYDSWRIASAGPLGAVVVPPPPSLLGAGRVPVSARCGHCQTETFTYLCPNCHFELSPDVGKVRQRIIAIIGGRYTGKSHYIASLITQLQEVVAANFQFTVHPMGDETKTRWENDFRIPLFEQRRVLHPTQPAALEPKNKLPLIFRLTFGGFGNTAKTGAVNLSFFDTAGEDLHSLDKMSEHAQYIKHADGIIFLLDPLQIEKVRTQLQLANLPASDPTAVPAYIVGNLWQLFESPLGVGLKKKKNSVTDKIQVPVAFALSKVDTLRPLLVRNSRLMFPGRHAGYCDLLDVQALHTEVEHYLQTWINRGFCLMVSQYFADYNYFGVSSLGEQPDAQNRLKTVAPLRVEDPFLWILYRLGMIGGKKG